MSHRSTVPAASRPMSISVTNGTFGGKPVTKTTTIIGNKDTVVFTDPNGKVVGAISSVVTPANAWNAGATQPYNQYNNVISK